MSKLFLRPPKLELQHQRLAARETIKVLINWHFGRIQEIDNGHHYYKNGEDITAQMRARHEKEIDVCRHVAEALKHMKAGDIQRAAQLCSQIQEHIPSLSD